MNINNVPKWNSELYPYLSDYIIQCFGKDLDRDETYWACANYLVLKNKNQRQELADHIAQIDTINIMATGRIPIAKTTQQKEVA